MLCHGKVGLCKFSILTNISFSVCQNLMELMVILFIYSFTMCSFFFFFLSIKNYVSRKGCLMYFTLRFFFYSQRKHFPISLRQFKICVADRKPQTIISVFPIYTKLYYRTQTQTKTQNTNYINVKSFRL